MHHELLEKISKWTNTLHEPVPRFPPDAPDLPHPSGESYGSRQFIRIGLGISQQGTIWLTVCLILCISDTPDLPLWYGKLSIMKIFGGTLW